MAARCTTPCLQSRRKCWKTWTNVNSFLHNILVWWSDYQTIETQLLVNSSLVRSGTQIVGTRLHKMLAILFCHSKTRHFSLVFQMPFKNWTNSQLDTFFWSSLLSLKAYWCYHQTKKIVFSAHHLNKDWNSSKFRSTLQ